MSSRKLLHFNLGPIIRLSHDSGYVALLLAHFNTVHTENSTTFCTGPTHKSVVLDTRERVAS
jgi:hypothetical protein